MNKTSFAEALRKMEASLAEKLVGFSSKKIREMTKELRDELLHEYDTFFALMVEDVIGALGTPSILSPYTSWKPLGEKWVFEKRKFGGYSSGNEHYLGLSNAATKRKQLGRTRKGGKEIGMSRLRAYSSSKSKMVSVGPFRDYIQSLNTAGTTARFFGPVSITYSFVSPDPNFSVTVNQDSGVVERTQVRSAKRGTFVAFPKELRMTATITAFGKLKGVTFNEKNVVDFIIKRIDPANEKQWVKINSEYGIGRSRRPIRAVVTPLLRYFIERRFPEIVRRAIKSRSK